MSTHRAPAQRLTNTFSVMPTTTCYFYNGATFASAFVAASAQQVGSLLVAPSLTAVTTAVGTVQAAAASAAPPAGTSLTDLGKTIIVEVNNASDGAFTIKLQEVKYQTNTSVFVTGYVVVENNYNYGNNSNNYLKVAVARA